MRKRLYVGEFRELGFEVSFKFRGTPDDKQSSAFWVAFILEAIERNGLGFGGGDTEGFVTAVHGSATEAHRQAVETWLGARTEVSSVKIGPLVDAWHGWDQGRPPV
ncbi:MAG: YggL family protein [Betaproteobacteria bacterium]